MKVLVQVTDDDGNLLEGEVTLNRVSKSQATKKKTRSQPKTKATKVDFNKPPRAFMNEYGRSLSGPKKFTLLLARMAEGKTKKVVSFRNIEKAWNRMKEVMGGKFNPAHTTRAKTKGWVDSPKQGDYVLLSGWEAALDQTTSKVNSKK